MYERNRRASPASPPRAEPAAAPAVDAGPGNAALVERLAAVAVPGHAELRPVMAGLDARVGERGGWKALSARLRSHFGREDAGQGREASAEHGDILAEAARVAAEAPETAGFVEALGRHAADEDRHGR